MGMADHVELSALVRSAEQTASRMRGLDRPLQFLGERTQSQEVQRFGKFGRMETVTQQVQVPVTLPGWQLGVERIMLRSGLAHSAEQILLTPDGFLTTVLVATDDPANFRNVSSRPLHAVRVAQSIGATPTWVTTGNSGDKADEEAARHDPGITAGAAVHLLMERLSSLG